MSPDTLSGKIYKIIYQKKQYAVINLKTSSEYVRAAGEFIDEIKEGEKIKITGTWEKHPKYGKQIKIKNYEKLLPETKNEAIDFLTSIKNIGKKTAKKIIETLGENAIEIIVKNPDALKKVNKIRNKEKISQQISIRYGQYKAIRQITQLGIETKTANKIYKELGAAAIEIIKFNPYYLSNKRIISFFEAEQIAEKLNKKDSIHRIEAGIIHTLEQAIWQEGHTFLPTKTIYKRLTKLLNKDVNQIKQKLKTPLSEDIIIEKDKIQLQWIKRCEEITSRKINVLKNKNYTINNLNIENLTQEQQQAVKLALSKGISIITGGAGTGKTQTIKAIINTALQNNIWDIQICAPTGRAARRITEITKYEAKTIHRLLKIKQNNESEIDRLTCDLLIIDEASMCDIVLITKLLNAVSDHCRVVLIGDKNQLPPIGPGNFFKDLIDRVPTTYLTKIFRQETNGIVINAHKIKTGQPICANNTDFFIIRTSNNEKIAQKVIKCLEKLSFNAQILTPVKKGLLGTKKLNRKIQERYGNKMFVEIRNKRFHLYDKVIQQKNNYDSNVMNGEIGIITELHDNAIVVQYIDTTVTYSEETIDEIESAWAITIHKSQGSEFENIIVPIITLHSSMLHRNLLYTAITRAQKRAILIGEPQAIEMAIKNNKPTNRYTSLEIF